MQPVTGPHARASVTGCEAYDYGPGQPNLYLMMRLKQQLVAAHGLETGFEKFRATFGLPDTVRLRDTSIADERAVAAVSARFFAEISAAGVRFVHHPPTVVGDGNHRTVVGTTRSEYVTCLADPIVSGRSALIHYGGRLLLDRQGDEGERLDDELDWDPVIFHAARDRVWQIDATASAPPMEIDEAFTLLGAHTDFFGHWMCEYLPKYVAARLSGFVPNVPVLIDSHMPASHRESLELLYGPLPIIEVPAFTPVRVRKLWTAPTLSYFPLHEICNERFSWDAVSLSPARFGLVIREVQRRFDQAEATSTSGSLVYLARKALRHRRLVNADAIEQAARSLGFAVVHPEELSFAEQASLVRQAHCVVAPEGSAIFLSIFARPGTTLCILSHPFTDVLADYNGLFGTQQIHTVAITGPVATPNLATPHDSDYRIDEATFRKTIEKLLRTNI